MKTAHKPTRELATNLNPTPITDRQHQVYHSRQEVETVGWWEKLKAWWNEAKFELAIKAIFIFAVVVSFSHTIELYSSVGFDDEIVWLNDLLRVDFITLALFATLAAEAAFAVGLWGLYEAYKQHQRFPGVKEFWQIWTLFGGGLIVVGWSNIGGTVGYDFLIGQPFKGIALGLSIPLFVLGAVLVNFKRMHQEPQPTRQVAEVSEDQPAHISASQPGTGHQSAIQSNQPNKASQSDESAKDRQPSASQNSHRETASQPVKTSATHPDPPVSESASYQQEVQPTATDQNSQQRANGSQADQQTSEDAGSASDSQPEKQPALYQTEKQDQPTKSSQPDQTPASGSANQSATGQLSVSESANQAQKANSQSVARSANKQEEAQPTKRVAKSTIQPNEEVVEEAEKYRTENGKWPSERKLAALAGVSRHQAGKVLDQLDESRAGYRGEKTAKVMAEVNG